MIGQIGHVSHHLESLVVAIKLTIVYAFVCKVGYFEAQVRGTLCTSRGYYLIS